MIDLTMINYVRDVAQELGAEGMDAAGVAVTNKCVIELVNYIDYLEIWLDQYRLKNPN